VVKHWVERVRATGATPFLTDTAVLYKSPRADAVGHMKVARDHGFTFELAGAEFFPADGLTGADEIEVRLEGGNHFETVAIASGIAHARSMLVVSHATGHLATGFGGALKNLGMGCCSRKGKLRQHSGQKPHVEAGACTACGTCAQWCPSDAIEVTDVAIINSDKCIGCGECIAACRDEAVQFDWAVNGKELQERIAEHAAAVVHSKPDRIGYVTVAQRITKDCDCMGLAQSSLLEDIGILASCDPVAIDSAVMSLVQQRAGKGIEQLSGRRHDGTVQLIHAEKLGVGSRDFELVPVNG